MIREVVSLPSAPKMKPFVTVTVVGIPVTASAFRVVVEATKSSSTTPVSAEAVATETAFDQSILSLAEFTIPVPAAPKIVVAGIRVSTPPRTLYVLYRDATTSSAVLYVTVIAPVDVVGATALTAETETVSVPRVVDAATPYASVNVYDACPFASVKIAAGATVGALAPVCVT